MINTDFLIVGSSLYGAVLAERISNTLNKEVILLEKGIINWPIKKLIYFGTTLLLEIFKWKQIIKKGNS